MEKQDYYSTLGVQKSASDQEIKSAYKKLALKYHPDRNPDNPEAEKKFKQAAQAYEILSNKEKRSAYDQFGHAGVDGSMGGHGGQHGMNMDDIFSNFGDIFGDIFGGGQQRRRRSGPQPQRGHDLQYSITITLKEAYLGTQKEIGYSRFFNCTDCDSKGARKGTTTSPCGECQGAGQISYRQGFFLHQQPCSPCRGQGYTISSPCSTCSGQSRVRKYDKFTFSVKRGVYQDAELRIANKGDAGVYGGSTGTLFVSVNIKPEAGFERVDDDLVCSVLLTYPQLVFGSHVEIENIDGTKETIKVKRGSAVGEKIIVPGKGFQNIKSKRSGNLVVITKCHIPQKISADAKKYLMSYSDTIGTNTTETDNSITGFFKKFLG